MIKCVRSPRHKDQETNKNGTNRIDVPDNAASDDRHSKTEGVDDYVVAVIDEEDMYRRITTVDVAVDAQ